MGDPVTYRLDALTEADCIEMQGVRNEEAVRSGLRTPYLATKESQQKFYREIVCNPSSPHRYYAIRTNDASGKAVGMVGLTAISWENGHAEISLVVTDGFRGQGVGRAAVDLVLEEAFKRMRLVTVFGECYENNTALAWWMKLVEAWPDAGWTTVPRRKFWAGKLYSSTFFWFVAVP